MRHAEPASAHTCLPTWSSTVGKPGYEQAARHPSCLPTLPTQAPCLAQTPSRHTHARTWLQQCRQPMRLVQPLPSEEAVGPAGSAVGHLRPLQQPALHGAPPKTLRRCGVGSDLHVGTVLQHWTRVSCGGEPAVKHYWWCSWNIFVIFPSVRHLPSIPSPQPLTRPPACLPAAGPGRPASPPAACPTPAHPPAARTAPTHPPTRPPTCCWPWVLRLTSSC